MTDTKTQRAFDGITQDAIGRMAQAEPRLRAVMTVVLRHLHDAVREARITEAEWEQAIDFLTRTGQKCDATRQEFILLSDVLGVSMLVDAINHDGGDEVTESTVFGPFYTGCQPVLPFGASILKRSEPGQPVTMKGRITSEGGRPIANALVEIWQAAPNGLYDVQDPGQPAGHMRGSFKTDEDGAYAFITVLPVSYAIPDDGPVGQLLGKMGRHPNRPAHTHFMISADGHKRLVTHLFIAGDPYLDSDAVFGVKPSLVVVPQADASGAYTISYDFALATLSVGAAGDRT
jgi:protocatechuate 3,4-dioxygenase beta subunit